MNDYEYSSLITVVIVSTCSIIVLAVGIVIVVIRHQNKMIQNKRELKKVEEEYQKKLLQSSVNSQERERERIARDLHDEIGASLSAAKLTLGLGLQQRNLDQDMANKVNEIIDHTIHNVKSISRELLPVNLKRFGLASALKDMCNDVSVENLYVSFKGEGTEHRLDGTVELGIYRIAQELVSNSIQHAQASLIEVNLICKEGFCILEVADNGVGFRNNKPSNSQGLGMDNINSRAQTIGGSIEFKNAIRGAGTHVKLTVPFQEG